MALGIKLDIFWMSRRPLDYFIKRIFKIYRISNMTSCGGLVGDPGRGRWRWSWLGRIKRGFLMEPSGGMKEGS